MEQRRKKRILAICGLFCLLISQIFFFRFMAGNDWDVPRQLQFTRLILFLGSLTAGAFLIRSAIPKK